MGTRRFPLHDGLNSFGRADDCDNTVGGDPSMSRLHFTVEAERGADGMYVYTLRSLSELANNAQRHRSPRPALRAFLPRQRKNSSRRRNKSGKFRIYIGSRIKPNRYGYKHQRFQS